MTVTYWYQDKKGQWRRAAGCDLGTNRPPDRAPAGQLIHCQDGPTIGGDDYWLNDQGRVGPSPLVSSH